MKTFYFFAIILLLLPGLASAQSEPDRTIVVGPGTRVKVGPGVQIRITPRTGAVNEYGTTTVIVGPGHTTTLRQNDAAHNRRIERLKNWNAKRGPVVNKQFPTSKYNEKIKKIRRWNEQRAPSINSNFDVNKHNQFIENLRSREQVWRGRVYPAARDLTNIDAFGPIQTNLKRWR